MAPAERPRTRSSAGVLAWGWAALVVYASLYPFAGWRWPPGAQALDLLALPWPRWTDSFDVAANLVGYVPLGALGYMAASRDGRARPDVLWQLVALGALLSLATEATQQLLPQRVPSAKDWALNTAGTLLGATLALLAQRWGVLDALRQSVNRWVQHRGSGAALLLAWPLGLLFPAPVPLGLGHVGTALRETLIDWLTDVPWAEPARLWLDEIEPAFEPLGPAAEWLVVTLGLVAPCMVAFAASRPGWRRVTMVLGALLLGVGVTTLTSALSFGPQHALAWRTATSVPALASGLVVALLLVRVGPRLAAGLGLLVITAMVVLVAQAPADPYFAQNLQGWEQGRFIRFHGAAQWIGWLWPYAAIAWLLHRVAAPE